MFIIKPLEKPEPYGPWIDVQTAKAAGQSPYVQRCAETGRIYDRVLNEYFPNSSEYGRITGHARYTAEPTSNKASMAEWAEIRLRAVNLPRRTIGRPRVTRGAIEAAYEEYVSGSAETAVKLYGLLEAFVYNKACKALFDFSECAVLPDDLAQEVLIAILQKIDEEPRTASKFFSWFNRIQYTTCANAVNEVVEYRKKQVELYITDDDGYLDDNPELYARSSRPLVLRELPAFIQGTDLLICGYIRDGYAYDKIAKLVGITLVALKKRLQRIKSRAFAERANKLQNMERLAA